jgi:hypothetical protein
MVPGAFGPEITKIPHMDEVLRRHRLIGSIRRECVDHVIALGEQHLRQVVCAQNLVRLI